MRLWERMFFMKSYIVSLLIALSLCLFLFGCGNKTEIPNSTAPESTTLPKAEDSEKLLPQDGYYVSETLSDASFYIYLEDLSGKFYMMNLPFEITLQDGLMISENNQDGVEYTYKNEKLTFEFEETKFTMKYVGDTLPEKYIPAQPPAGTYAVSSVGGVDGSMDIYSELTDEILTLAEDGTGTFLFAEKTYEILLQDYVLLVDGEPIGYSYYPEGGETPIWMLLWANEEAGSIALRPVTE